MSEEYKPITNLWKDSEGYRYFGTLKLSSKIKYDGDDFIPLWEWVKLLQEELEEYKNVTDENKKLKDNWNKLKEYVGVEWYSYDNDSVEFEVAKDILNKMQELERSDSNEI